MSTLESPTFIRLTELPEKLVLEAELRQLRQRRTALFPYLIDRCHPTLGETIYNSVFEFRLVCNDLADEMYGPIRPEVKEIIARYITEQVHRLLWHNHPVHYHLRRKVEDAAYTHSQGKLNAQLNQVLGDADLLTLDGRVPQLVRQIVLATVLDVRS